MTELIQPVLAGGDGFVFVLFLLAAGIQALFKGRKKSQANQGVSGLGDQLKDERHAELEALAKRRRIELKNLRNASASNLSGLDDSTAPLDTTRQVVQTLYEQRAQALQQVRSKQAKGTKNRIDKLQVKADANQLTNVNTASNTLANKFVGQQTQQLTVEQQENAKLASRRQKQAAHDAAQRERLAHLSSIRDRETKAIAEEKTRKKKRRKSNSSKTTKMRRGVADVQPVVSQAAPLPSVIGRINIAALRQAVIYKEILDQPLALRPNSTDQGF